MEPQNLQLNRCLELSNEIFEILSDPIKTPPQILGELSFLGSSFYKYLNLSVLSGEYVLLEEFEQKIDEILEGLKHKFSSLNEELPFDADTETSDKSIEFVRLEYFSYLFNPLKTSLLYYKTFVHSFWTKIKNPEKQYLINHIEPEENFETDKLNLEIYSDLFDYNVILSNVDFSLTLTHEHLQRLFFVLNKIKKRKDKTDIIPQLLLEKSKLLIFKFKLKYDSTSDFKQLLISFDFDEEEFDPNTIELIHLNDLKTKILDFYPSNSEYTSLRNRCRNNRKKLDEYSFTDIFATLKYHKEVTGNLEEVENLLQELKGRGIPENYFDRRCSEICQNYILNNKISLRLVSDDIELREVDALVSQVVQLQEISEVKNFFPFFKISQFYIEYLKIQFNSTVITNQKLEELRHKNSKLQEYLEKSKEYLMWDISHNFIPFHSPYKECCTTVKPEGVDNITVFIMTSFIVPVDYEKRKKELDSMELKSRSFESIIDVHQSISQEKSDIKTTKKDIEEAKKNNIEVLSIFAAIVMFVSSNIQIFSRLSDMKSAAIFTMFFAYAMCLFVVMIWFVVNTHRNRQNEKLKIPTTQKWIIGLLIAGLLINLYFIFCGSDIPLKT